MTGHSVGARSGSTDTSPDPGADGGAGRAPGFCSSCCCLCFWIKMPLPVATKIGLDGQHSSTATALSPGRLSHPGACAEDCVQA